MYYLILSIEMDICIYRISFFAFSPAFRFSFVAYSGPLRENLVHFCSGGLGYACTCKENLLLDTMFPADSEPATIDYLFSILLLSIIYVTPIEYG